MTHDEMVDRINLATRLRAEATAHRRAARRYIAAANDLLSILPMDGGRKHKNGASLVIAEHSFGTVQEPQQQQHHS